MEIEIVVEIGIPELRLDLELPVYHGRGPDREAVGSPQG